MRILTKQERMLALTRFNHMQAHPQMFATKKHHPFHVQDK